MLGGKHLLLLAATVLLARCQQKLQVSLAPKLPQIFSGDLFYLRCENSSNTVKWFANSLEQAVTDETWKINVATSMQSGSYHCETSGQKSNNLPIDVKEYLPRATLFIKTGQPVMRSGESVILQLDNDDGLQGWKCWVFRGKDTKRIVLRLRNGSESHVFQPKSLRTPETIFWCTDSTGEQRSNQITIRTSDKPLSLEMYPLPAVAGDTLTLRCLVWGTEQITHTVFYKDNAVIHTSSSPTYKIQNVTDSAMGRYKCCATFTYKGHAGGPPFQMISDNQDVLVQAAPMKAVLSASVGLSCSCPQCPGHASYRWYYMNDDEPSVLKDSSQGFMMPKESGTYACRAVWRTGRSSLSNSHTYNPTIKPTLIIMIIAVLLIIILVACFIFYKKRMNTTGPLYEDVQLRSRDKYETLQTLHGAKREYDTLHPEAQGRENKVGQYEVLMKGEVKDPVYHTLGMEGAAGKEGGYEALKKEGMKEGEYQTLAKEGIAGGAGAYEALKKEGMKEGEYQTLAKEGIAGGAGAYEALKKEGMKEGEYQTLAKEGIAGGAGAYEALKKEGMKEGEYQTLAKEGAGGGESRD